MLSKKFLFNRLEFAGSLGDLGTLIPLSVGMIVFNGLNLTIVFLIVGLFYILTGLYFRLPIPVQPLKVVAAVAIAFPEKITAPVISATGIIFGIILLFLAGTGIIKWLARLFTKPVIRGIQVALGLILISRGIGFIIDPDLFIQGSNISFPLAGIPVNIIIGITGTLITLYLLSSSRFPAALILILAGAVIGIFYGALEGITLEIGPKPLSIGWPALSDFYNAFFLLILPQIPLTIGNAIIGTTDTAHNLFTGNENLQRSTNRGFSTSMGLVNLVTGFLGGMPVCHGSGGLAAHYRFGARTGGSNIMIGLIFIFIALVFGKIGISILSIIPNSVLGILLLFAGLELTLLLKDTHDRKDLFIVFIIAGTCITTKNMGIAFLAGIIIEWVIRMRKIEV